MNRHQLWWALIFSLIFVGCSFQATPLLIKIGLVAPFEGQYRNIGYDALWAVKLAVQEVNSAGGVGGYRVELVALNDNADPQQAWEQARELARDPQVMGVIGHFREDTALAALDAYHQAGLVLIAPAVSALELTRSGYDEVFRLGASEEELIVNLVEFVASTRDVQWMAIVAEPHPRPVQDVAELQGIELQGFVSPQEFLREGQGRRFDLIFFGGSDTSAADFLVKLQEEVNPPELIGGENLNSRHILAWAGEAAQGLIYATSTQVVTDPQFVAAYRALAGGDPGPWAGLAYDATKLLLQAMARAIEADGHPSREGVIHALQRGEVFHGLSGDIDFDDQGNLIDPPIYIYRLENEFPGERLN